MKIKIPGCFIVGAMALPLMLTAAPNDGLERAVAQVDRVATSAIKLSGYADVGYVYNFGAPTVARGFGADRQRGGNFNVSQVRLALDKPLTVENRWQAGFGAALMLGEDAAALSGRRGVSALWLQHAYVSLRAPIGNGLDSRLGRLCSILGYESDERPANLNITKGASAALDPCFATGAFFSYPATEWLTVLAGVNNGSAADTNNGFDTDSDGYAFFGGLRARHDGLGLASQLAVQFAPWGEECPRHANHASAMCAADNGPVVGVNWWLDWTPKTADGQLLLALNASLWSWGNTMIMPMPMPASTATFSAVAAYAKYQFTPLISLAGRVEYVHTHNGEFNARRGTSYFWNNGLEDGDLYTTTLTAGFNVAEDFLVRVEYRFDYGKKASAEHDGAHLAAVEVVYAF
ncbi:MAG: porin [Verrucomicrobiales bacterium]|nr:porin [Verrucomicrobiales bacterium]